MINKVLDNGFVNEIKELIDKTKIKIVKDINFEMVLAYWNIGKKIVDEENKHDRDSSYGDFIVDNLSKELGKTYGKGFSRSNLFSMRKLFLTYKKVQTLSGQLSWSHYLKLLQITDDNSRRFYEQECINSNWSVRELHRQIDSSLYERLLLSKGEVNKNAVLELAEKGVSYSSPADVAKDPMVLEFLGVAEEKPKLESDLEKALIDHIEDFLLELGRGFMFVGSQQRISIAGRNYYVDMVFYNKILRCYVLIDLKMRGLEPENFGQMNLYVNYYKKEMNDEGDNDPIGIILCAEKDRVVAEYALDGLENNIYASKYTYVLPNKEELENEVNKLLEAGK